MWDVSRNEGCWGTTQCESLLLVSWGYYFLSTVHAFSEKSATKLKRKPKIQKMIEILHITQFCHLSVKGKVPPLLAIKWWIKSLPLPKPYENKILKCPTPLHTFSNDNDDNSIPSPDQKHQKRITTLSKLFHILTLLKIHPIIENSVQSTTSSRQTRLHFMQIRPLSPMNCEFFLVLTWIPCRS